MASGYNSPNYTDGEFNQLQLKGNHGRTPRIKTEVELEYDSLAQEITITPSLLVANELKAGSRFQVSDLNGTKVPAFIDIANPNQPLVIDVSGLAQSTMENGDWLVSMSLDNEKEGYESTVAAKRIDSGRALANQLFFDTTAA